MPGSLLMLVDSEHLSQTRIDVALRYFTIELDQLPP
jgi:hypothetical protein